MQIPQTVRTRGCCCIGVQPLALAMHNKFGIMQREEWDLRGAFVQANVHATCESTLHGPR